MSSRKNSAQTPDATPSGHPLSSDILIRNANPDDAMGVAQLHTESWQSAYRGLLSDAYLDGPLSEEHRKRWLNLLAAPHTHADSKGNTAESRNTNKNPPRPDGFILIAERDERLLGFISVWFKYKEGYDAYVDNLHVRPDLRGGGIGGRLLRASAVRISAEGYKNIALEVLNGNLSAIRFYENMGGISRNQDHEEMGGVMVDYRLMAWDDANTLAE